MTLRRLALRLCGPLSLFALSAFLLAAPSRLPVTTLSLRLLVLMALQLSIRRLMALPPATIRIEPPTTRNYISAETLQLRTLTAMTLRRLALRLCGPLLLPFPFLPFTALSLCLLLAMTLRRLALCLCDPLLLPFPFLPFTTLSLCLLPAMTFRRLALCAFVTFVFRMLILLQSFIVLFALIRIE